VQDGIAFLHEFRSYAEWQNIPVILNTYLTPAALAKAHAALERDLGVRVCLYKPQTTLEQLLRVLKAQLAAT
jgi:CheY-like chemotaxis protein